MKKGALQILKLKFSIDEKLLWVLYKLASCVLLLPSPLTCVQLTDHTLSKEYL